MNIFNKYPFLSDYSVTFKNTQNLLHLMELKISSIVTIGTEEKGVLISLSSKQDEYFIHVIPISNDLTFNDVLKTLNGINFASKEDRIDFLDKILKGHIDYRVFPSIRNHYYYNQIKESELNIKQFKSNSKFYKLEKIEVTKRFEYLVSLIELIQFKLLNKLPLSEYDLKQAYLIELTQDQFIPTKINKNQFLTNLKQSLGENSYE